MAEIVIPSWVPWEIVPVQMSSKDWAASYFPSHPHHPTQAHNNVHRTALAARQNNSSTQQEETSHA